jgi:hypothetical protein
VNGRQLSNSDSKQRGAYEIASHFSNRRCGGDGAARVSQLVSSGVQSFLRQPYPVDATMCGNPVVWISRAMLEKQLPPVGASERTASATLER